MQYTESRWPHVPGLCLLICLVNTVWHLLYDWYGARQISKRSPYKAHYFRIAKALPIGQTKILRTVSMMEMALFQSKQKSRRKKQHARSWCIPVPFLFTRHRKLLGSLPSKWYLEGGRLIEGIEKQSLHHSKKKIKGLFTQATDGLNGCRMSFFHLTGDTWRKNLASKHINTGPF